MITAESLKEKLKERKHIIITTHFKPDGDALGSSLALFHWLSAKGHDVKVILPSDYPYFLKWMPGAERCFIYTDNSALFDQFIADADLIFCLDFNGLGRTQEMAGALREAKGLKVMIDHHLDPDGFDDFRYWNPSAAATAQLIYTFITEFFQEGDFLTEDIATCLYAGIMTDTGSFRYKSTTAEVHRIVAELLELGVKSWLVHEHIFNSNTERRLNFLGFCLLNRLEVLPNYKTAIFAIGKDDLERFEIETGETEGLVNYALSIAGIRLAVLIIERDEAVKMSFRSLGDFPCNELSKKHFNGGGHLNAAGGMHEKPLGSALAKLKEILPEYQASLNA